MSETWQVLHGDALAELAQLEGPFAATITDPPYCSGGISEAARKGASAQGIRHENARRLGWFENDAMGTAGLVWLLRTVALAAAERTPDGGWFLTFADWRMLSSIQPAIESAGWSYRSLVVWDKGSMGLGVGFRAQHECILAFSRGAVAPDVHDRSVGNVLRCPRPTRKAEDRDHPTEKPVELMETLIRVTTPPGGLVVDPFCGSGTTGVAAVRLGRRFVGIERSEDHAATARARCSSATPAAFQQAALEAAPVAPIGLFT